MKLLAVSFLLALALHAQVSVSLSPVPPNIAKRILNGRAAKTVMPWVATMRNVGTEPVVVSESALLRYIPQLQPIDIAQMAPLIEEARKNSPLERAANGLSDAMTGANLAAATRKLRGSWPEILGYGLEFLPFVITRLHANENPVTDVFSLIAWKEPVKLQPGDTAAVHVFTARWDLKQIQPQTFTMQVGAQAVKVAQ